MTAIPTALGELSVRVHGSGPTAVLWHSLFVDDRSWDPLADALQDDRTLVRITGPGHGASEPVTRRYTLDDCAAAALEVLKRLDVVGPVDWLGTAWGGHVGIVIAATRPGTIRTLASFNAPVQALGREERGAPRLLAALLRTVGPIRPARERLVEALLGERTRAGNPAAVAYVHECLRAAKPAALANAIRSISLGRPDLRRLLPSIRVPTLFVTSPDDALWTPAQAEAAAALVPGAEWAVIPETGHLTPLEAPAESAELIRAFWGRAGEHA